MMLPKSKPPRSEKYRRWIASQPCLICASPETQAAHTERGGRGMKGQRLFVRAALSPAP